MPNNLLAGKVGIISGALAWLGFVATTMTVNHGYQGQKLSLILPRLLEWNCW